MERAILSIKRFLRAMIAQRSKRWLGLLPQLTKAYNNSYHRSTGKVPAHVSYADNATIWKGLYYRKATSRRNSRRYMIGYDKISCDEEL